MSPRSPKGFFLTELALKRPVGVIMLAITLVGLGVISWTRIPLEFLPKIEFPFLGCYIPYPGSTPEQVANEVAEKAEAQFRTIAQLERISTSSDTNGCWVSMSFEQDSDMTVVSGEVRDRMERLKLVLPDEIDHIFLRRWNSNAMPVLVAGMFPAEGEDPDEFGHRVRTVAQPRLLRIDGVADVQIFSSRPGEDVLIQFDQDALQAMGLALYDIVGQLQQSNLKLSAGEIEQGSNKYYVRVSNELERPEQIANLPIGPHGLRLSEVAEVDFGQRETQRYFAVDGQIGTFMIVRKESEANTVATCRAVREELDRLILEQSFEGSQKAVFFDQSEMIVSALDGLVKAARYGGIMALAVLFIFLRRVRPTIAVAFATPASLVASLIFMYFTDMTINMVTMVAIIISLGMLVDNSIVVIENIYRYRDLGYDQIESARRGASEVAMAITAATTTTIVVFLPVLYMEMGEMAIFMRQMAFPVGVALLASLVLALTAIPLAASRTCERHELRSFRLLSKIVGRRDKTAPRSAGVIKRAWLRYHNLHVLRRTIAVYTSLLGMALRWRLAALMVLAVVVVLTVQVPFRQVAKQKSPEMDRRTIEIRARFDQNFDGEAIMATARRIEDVVEEYRDELGIKNIFARTGDNDARIEAYLRNKDDLEPGETLKYSTDEARDVLAQRLPDRFPGVELKIQAAGGGQQHGGGDPAGSGQIIALQMRGDDLETLEGYAQELARILESLPNISEAESDLERAQDEVQLTIDETLAEQAGVNPSIVAQTVSFALRGRNLVPIKQGGREIPVYAQFREEDRQTRENLDNVSVMGADGRLVPLSQLVQYGRAKRPRTIRRENARNVVTVVANVEGDFAQAMQQVEAVRDSFDLPRSYSIDRGDQIEEMLRAQRNMIMAMMLSIALVFIVMSALFESLLLPLSILTTIPLAFIGVYWTLYLTKTPVDPIAMIGFILMVGIVVNNGIVIIDHINQLRRREGFDRYDAMIQAGRDRFRPVMMTAITTILGSLPLAIGSGLGEVQFSGVGRTLVGGLGVGTLLTLFIVPLFYSLIDDAQRWATNLIGDLLGLGRRVAPTDPAA